MQIAIVTDEMSADPETAFELGLELGIRHFELRGVYSDRIPRISAHAKARLLRAIRSFGVEITAVSPGLFKIPVPDPVPEHSNLGWMDAGFFDRWERAQALLADHTGPLLDETIAFAAEVGARNIVSFGFHRNGLPAGPAPQAVIEHLARAAERIRAAGLSLLVETEEGFWADSGARTAAIVSAIGPERIGVNWDPANAFCEGDVPFPDGYESIRPHVRNVHFKDAHRTADGRATFTFDGEVDWEGQIRALIRDRYDGFIAVEPHLDRPVSAVRRSLERLRGLIAAAGDTTTRQRGD